MRRWAWTRTELGMVRCGLKWKRDYKYMNKFRCRCHNRITTASRSRCVALPVPPQDRFHFHFSWVITSTLYSFSLSPRGPDSETVIQHHNSERVLFKLFFGHEQHTLRENSFKDLGTHTLQMTHKHNCTWPKSEQVTIPCTNPGNLPS